MLDAVLFDWGDTLFHFAYDEELLEAGWKAGLAALDRESAPSACEAAARFREGYLPAIWQTGALEEIEYPALVAELLSEFGVSVTGEELDRFLLAEHEAWAPARRVGEDTHELLDELRARRLFVGLVSNAFDPGWLLRRDLAEMGLATRLDVAVFSSEVGMRKPHPSIFEAALGELGVEPGRTLFVGDRRYEDVRGSKELGMRAVQAVWYRADEDPRGLEPDFEAAAPLDVLGVVWGLLGEA